MIKRKKYLLGTGPLYTILAASFYLSHIASVSAKRAFHVLDGIEIVLDPGHGGKDDGVRSSEVEEQETNLKIAQKLRKLLGKGGAHVTMTCNGAYDLASEGASNRKHGGMEERIELIDRDKTDLFIGIHLNSCPNTGVRGAQAFYAPKNEVSKVFADIVQKHFHIPTQAKMTSKPGGYYILNDTQKIGSLVGCGFLSNAEGRAKFVTDEYQQEVAQVLYDSMLEYFSFLS